MDKVSRDGVPLQKLANLTDVFGINTDGGFLKQGNCPLWFADFENKDTGNTLKFIAVGNFKDNSFRIIRENGETMAYYFHKVFPENFFFA